MYTHYLFDLDGTLTKSESGIYNCIRYALDWAGIADPGEEILRKFIGPSLHDSFSAHFQMSDERAAEMVKKYRERYNTTGLFENEVYDGIYDLLGELKHRGKVLAVATSKPYEATIRILEHFRLAEYFDVIIGSRPDNISSNKALLISQVLERLPEASKTGVMIGDRMYDIQGGQACGLDTIGVLYGYGQYKELKEAGATYIVHTPAEILTI